jgi:hypothetical protein
MPRRSMASGVVIALVAFGLVFHVDDHPRRSRRRGRPTCRPRSRAARAASASCEAPRRGAALAVVHKTPGKLPDYGVAPQIHATETDQHEAADDRATARQGRPDRLRPTRASTACTLPHLEAWNDLSQAGA